MSDANPPNTTPPAPGTPAPPHKRSVLKTVLIGLVLLVIVFVAVVAAQPSDFRISRSTVIDAPPDAVFAHVNDFHKWEDWSPWAKLDPNAQTKFEGPSSGKGAVFHWSGNEKVGAGSMTIVDSEPSDRIGIKLDFLKPFQATNAVELTFKPEGEQTRVTWTMTGTTNFVGKAVCMFMDRDKMVGGDFEKGLAQLKLVVEQEKHDLKQEEPPVRTEPQDEAPSAPPTKPSE